MAIATTRWREQPVIQPRVLRIGVLPVLVGVLLLSVIASIAFGAADIRAHTVWSALAAFDGSTEHLIIRTLRVPRALICVLVGAALGISGGIMQGLTRNPLADPTILGISSGAAFAVVIAISLLHVASLTAYTWFAFAGAGATALIVYGISSIGRDGPTPLKLTIAGAALTALLSSLTTGLLIFNQRTLEEVRFWLAGSVAGRDLKLLLQVLPYMGIGLILALMLGRQLSTLSLGDDVARGLGQRTLWVKSLAALAVVLLAGSSVAVAGPIGFVGLVIPHVVRFFVGVDYRWILPYAALLGAILLVLADIAARLVLRPLELPVGIMTALLGGPIFIYLAQRKVRT